MTKRREREGKSEKKANFFMRAVADVYDVASCLYRLKSLAIIDTDILYEIPGPGTCTMYDCSKPKYFSLPPDFDLSPFDFDLPYWENKHKEGCNLKLVTALRTYLSS